MTDVVINHATVVSIDNPVADIEVITVGIPGIVGPQGIPGLTGPANVLSIGTVTTSSPGSSASATITGTSPAQVLNLVLPQGTQGPQGNDGPAPNLSIGTVTTLAAGSSATAAVNGTNPNYTLDLGIPTGPQGPQGNAGDMGPADTATITGTVDLSVAAYTAPCTRVLTLSGNVTFTNQPPAVTAGKSGTVTLVLIQAATGGPYTVNWPAGITWVGNAPGPTMPTTASYKLICHLFWDGVEWTGMNAGARS